MPAALWSTSSPAVADGVVVVGGRDGTVYGLRASTGRRLWQFKAGDAVLASPAIHQGRVFVPSLDNNLYALRLADGTLVWKRDLGGLEQSSPTVVGDSILVAGGYPSRQLFRIDTATGTVLWKTAPGVMAQFSNSSAVSDGHQVIVGAMEGHLYSFDLATGAHLWTYEADGMVNLAAPVIVGDRVYLLPGGASGRLHAVELATGRTVANWPVELPAPAADPSVVGKLLLRAHAVSSLAVAGNRLIFDIRFDDSIDTDDDGVADEFLMREIVMAVSATDGRQLWQRSNGRRLVDSFNDLPKNWLCPTPAIYQAIAGNGASGTSLVAAASTLLPTIQTLDSSSGANRANTALAGPTRVSPVMANGRLIVGTEGGVVQANLSSSNQPPDAPVIMGMGGQARPVSNVAPTIRWTAPLDPNGDALSYQLRLDRDGEVLESSEIEVTTGPGETSARLPRDLVAGATYVEAVRARDSQGAWSEWSAPAFVRAVATPTVSIGGDAQASLVAALAGALAGTTVKLGAGIYYLSETVNVPPGVSLEGAGPQSSILDARGLPTGVSLEGTADGKPSTVKSLTVAGAQVGISIRDTRDARIQNVIVRDNWETGVEVGASGAGSIINVTLAANGRAVRSFGAVTVKNSIITGNQTGFAADHAGAIVSKFNDLSGNAVAFQGMTRGADDITSDVSFVSYPKRDLHVTRGQASTDRGDPGDAFAAEPAPNGGRINLGAFGGTAEAELSAPASAPAAPLTPPAAGGCSVAPPTAGGRTGDPGSSDLRTSDLRLRDWRALLANLLLGLLAIPLFLRRRRRTGVLLILFACFSPRPSEALTCTWKGSGGTGGNNWSQSTKWTAGGSGGSAACPPVTTNDSAVFNTGSVACAIAADVTVGSISITSGYTGSVTASSGVNINVAGNLSHAGATNFTASSGQLLVGGDLLLSSSGTFTAPSALLSVGGAFTQTAGTFTHNSGTVILASPTNQSLTATGTTFNNLMINDGLVGYWKGDEGTGLTLSDSSGYGNDGTLVNGPAWVTAPANLPTLNFKDAAGISLDGVDDYVTLGVTNLPAINGNMTVAFWMYYAAIPGVSKSVVVLKQSTASGLQIGFKSNAITAYKSGGTALVTASSTPASGWHHVAYTFDGTTHSLYVDGGTPATATTAANTGATTTAWLGTYNGSSELFAGRLDEVRIYNRVLTSTEISSLSSGNQPGTLLATQTAGTALGIAGDLVIASGKLSTGSHTLSVGGNWLNYGGIYTATGGMVTMTGTASSTLTVLSAGSRFQDITFNGSGASFTLADNMETDPHRVVNMTAGTFDLSSYTLRTGDLNRNGALTLTPSTGTVVFDADASRTIDTGTFYNLQFEPVAATNLIGYWKLDDSQGPTARDYGSGSTNGTLNGLPSWTATQAPGIDFYDPGALNFHGTTSNDYVDIPTPVIATNAAFSACAWVNMTATAGYQSFVSIDGTNESGFYLQKRTDTGKFSFSVRATDSNAATVFQASGLSAPSAATWYHLCGTYDVANLRLYVNGVLQSTTAFSTLWNATGHTLIGAGKDSGAHKDYVNGIVDDVRIYNVALTGAQVAALAAGGYPAGLAGAPTYTLGYDTTVSGSFALYSGTLATSTFALNASTATNVANVTGGTYSVGSAAQTFAGGLNVGSYATLDLPTSGGSVNIGSTKTLNLDGTLSAASTGATIQTAGGAATYYNFNVGTSATATPTLNITGLAVKNTTSNGMYINSVVGSTTTFTRFDNIAFSGGTGTQLLQIYAPTLYLVSNGCTFDTGVATGSTTYNATLRGDGSATETRVVFGTATCATNKTPCEGSDNDDDSTADGVGDTVATNGAVIQWVHSASADTSGTIEGFPTAALDWNTFTYYSTYVTYHDVGGGTTDRIYVRDTNGIAKSATSYWDGPAGENIIGTPRYDTVSNVHYVYVATTAGKVYRLVDDTTANTLTQDSTGSWAGANNPYNCSCTITTPLTLDANNLYWGGTATGNKVWTLGKTTRTLASSSPFAVTAVISGAAPTTLTSGDTYIFMGSAAHFYKVDITTQTLTTDNASPTGNVNGRLSLINSKLYGVDTAGSLWVLNPTTFSTTLWSYHDNTNHNGCVSGVCAVTGSVYVDVLLNRAFYGDSDGHLYASYNTAGTTGGQATGFPYRPGSSSEVYGTAPFYNAGIMVAGTTTGNLYIIDVNGGSGPVLKQTYKFGATTSISGVGYDRTSASYMVATADATNKDGKLIYIDAMTDPTPGSN